MKKALSLMLALVMSLGLYIVPAYADGGAGMIEGLNGEYYLLSYGGGIGFIDQNGKDRKLNSDEINALNWSWTQNEDGWHTLVLNGCEGKYLSLGLTTHLILSDGSVNTFERVNLDCYNDCPELSIEGTGELIATSKLSIFQNSGPILLAKNLQMTGGLKQGDSFPLTYDTTVRVKFSDDPQVPKTGDGSNATYVRIAPIASTDDQPEKPSEPAQQPAGTVASPTNDKLEVNGAAANPTVYKIGDSNYFKIRDVAALLNGTEKQFSVGYDGEKNAVTATPGQGYDKLDTDLAGAPSGGSQDAELSNDAIYVNGEKITAEVYKIGGSNYFKLRDLGRALDFYVGWSAERGIYIETSKPYSE